MRNTVEDQNWYTTGPDILAKASFIAKKTNVFFQLFDLLKNMKCFSKFELLLET